jgi:WD40 repeat protein
MCGMRIRGMYRVWGPRGESPSARRMVESWLISGYREELPEVCSVAWAGDGSFLAIGNDQGDVELWDSDTGQRVRKMAGHQVRCRAIETGDIC